MILTYEFSLCSCQATQKVRKENRRKRSAAAASANKSTKAHPSPSSSSTAAAPAVIEAKTEDPAPATPRKTSTELREEERHEREKFLAQYRPVLVPTSACLFVMFSYVLVGALVFSSWEKWNFIDGSYFCFVSLLTIGFGDLVPGQAVKEYTDNTSQSKLIVCAFYLLIGMSLIAMCFNLMQAEAIHNIRSLATKIGLLRSRRNR